MLYVGNIVNVVCVAFGGIATIRSIAGAEARGTRVSAPVPK